MLLGQALLHVSVKALRSPDGRLYKGVHRPSLVGIAHRVPWIPVAMIGTNVVNPPGRKMLRFGRSPFGLASRWTSPVRGVTGNHFLLSGPLDEAIGELMGLSGQEYVDIYAASVKDGRNAAVPVQIPLNGRRTNPRDSRWLVSWPSALGSVRA